mmetsp:Transcript_82970/g.146605  ORF Transcript_82970/g.146605 Transcript_82970/m.146605 type:complete len:510 (-) Transcript_82970:169-1698(-)
MGALKMAPGGINDKARQKKKTTQQPSKSEQQELVHEALKGPASKALQTSDSTVEDLAAQALQDDKNKRSCLHKQLRKTKFCIYHLQGVCQFGKNCAFAHNCKELQGAPDLRKTKLCKLTSGGECMDPYCSFAHTEEELRSTDMFYKKTLCIWHEKGRCRNGDQCRFAHGIGELRASANAAIQDDHQGDVASSNSQVQQKQLPATADERPWSSGSAFSKASVAATLSGMSTSSGSSGSSYSGNGSHAQQLQGSHTQQGHMQNVQAVEALAAAQAAYRAAAVHLTQQMMVAQADPQKHTLQQQEPMFVQTAPHVPDVGAHPTAFLEHLNHLEHLQQSSARLQKLVAVAEHSNQMQADVQSLQSQLSQLNRLKAAANIIDSQRDQRPLQPRLPASGGFDGMQQMHRHSIEDGNLDHLVQNISSLANQLNRVERELHLRQSSGNGTSAALNNASQAFLQQAVLLQGVQGQGREKPSPSNYVEGLHQSNLVPNAFSVPQMDPCSMNLGSSRFQF